MRTLDEIRADLRTKAEIPATASEGQRYAVAYAIEKLFPDDAYATKKRHSLMKWLIGKDSVKILTSGEIIALLRWASFRDIDGIYWPRQEAMQEAALIIQRIDEEQGQMRLF